MYAIRSYYGIAITPGVGVRGVDQNVGGAIGNAKIAFLATLDNDMYPAFRHLSQMLVHRLTFNFFL